MPVSACACRWGSGEARGMEPCLSPPAFDVVLAGVYRSGRLMSDFPGVHFPPFGATDGGATSQAPITPAQSHAVVMQEAPPVQ